MTMMINYRGRAWRVPQEHYSANPLEAVFFYGGPGSNFVGGPYKIGCVQPWSNDELYIRTYHRVEKFFAASKATNRAEHDRIANIADTWAAKAEGRNTELRQDWEAVKYSIMLTGLRAKVVQDNTIRRWLMSTGNRLIAEDSPTDYEWGIRDAQGGYTGNNLLGKAWMEVRRWLQQQERAHRRIEMENA